MSMLFSPCTIGRMSVKNRFMHSATYESMSGRDGIMSEALLKRYRQLAKGDVGLIIPGHMYVHPTGKAGGSQVGIFSDDHVDGLRQLTSTIHDAGGKVVFQLSHAGRQTRKEVTGMDPIGPSRNAPDPTFGVMPVAMTEADIQTVISAFGSAARRAVDAGADGVQIHGAHGYLVNQFLSPFFNCREDNWGGSDENRFRFLKELFLAIRESVGPDLPVLIKLNTKDFTPGTGMMPELAARYAKWLVDLGIDGIEISSGTLSFSPLATSRFKGLEGELAMRDAYHLEAAEVIKPVLGDVPLILVGGMRKREAMETVLQDGKADMISMSRPLIREPHLVKRMADGKTDEASCVSCNNCLMAVRQGHPVRCYVKGLPE